MTGSDPRLHTNWRNRGRRALHERRALADAGVVLLLRLADVTPYRLAVGQNISPRGGTSIPVHAGDVDVRHPAGDRLLGRVRVEVRRDEVARRLRRLEPGQRGRAVDLDDGPLRPEVGVEHAEEVGHVVRRARL